MRSEDRQRDAQLRLHARRARQGELRRRAIFLSLSLFALLWVAVFAQMVSGHDPVLANGNRVAAKTSKSARNPAVSATAQASTNQNDGLTATSSTAARPAPATPAPVVTSQS